jgi:hypothetical protein
MPLVTKRARGGDATGGSGDGDAAGDENEHHVCARGGCGKAGIMQCGECKQVCVCVSDVECMIRSH